MKNKEILITGANGFIGRHLISKLLKGSAYKITCIIRNKESKIELQENKIKIIYSDLLDDNLKLEKNYDFVFHLAALANINKSLESPELSFKINTLGTLRLLTKLKNFNGKFIYSSTLGVYGNQRILPNNETQNPNPLEPYATSKLAGEYIVSSICKSRNIKYCIARLFNCYGEEQTQNSLIPMIIRKILNDEVIELKNPNIKRDFIYVKDVVDALILLAERGEGIYNVGTGKETSLGELVEKISIKLNKTARLSKNSHNIKNDEIEVWRSRADINKIKKFGWKPKYTLEKGLNNLIKNQYKNAN